LIVILKAKPSHLLEKIVYRTSKYTIEALKIRKTHHSESKKAIEERTLLLKNKNFQKLLD